MKEVFEGFVEGQDLKDSDDKKQMLKNKLLQMGGGP